jgi:TPR repeat protein
VKDFGGANGAVVALDWYKKAAAQGNEEAKVAAARLEESNTRTP